MANIVSKNTLDEINAQYGKLPPQAIEEEEAVLAALMLERDAIITNPVKINWFYKSEHQKILEGILDLHNKRIPIDMLIVTRWLKDHNALDEIGGATRIAEIIRRVASAAHIEHHIRIIYQKFLQREVIRISLEAQIKAYDDSLDVDDLMEFLQKEILPLISSGT